MSLCQGDGRDEQRTIGVGAGFPVGGEVAEDAEDGFGEFGARGEQADVGVEARGDRVVVAGAEMRVAANDAVGVAANDERELAVGLVAEDAVEDLHAGVFELARPADVGGLVEARHELDDDGDVLALRGLFECAEDGRVGAGAVEGLLDGDDVLVGGGGGDEVFDGAVAVEGMVQQDVFLAELGEDVGGRLGGLVEVEAAAVELGELERGQLDGAVEGHEAREVDGRGGAEDLPGFELEVGAQAFGDLFGGEGVDLHADGVALAAIVQLLGDASRAGSALSSSCM